MKSLLQESLALHEHEQSSEEDVCTGSGRGKRNSSSVVPVTESSMLFRRIEEEVSWVYCKL